MQHKLSTTEAALEKAEGEAASHKQAGADASTHQATNESLLRKIALLESELDAADKNLRETTDKLRQVDVRAEHFERQVQRLEAERDACVGALVSTRLRRAQDGAEVRAGAGAVRRVQARARGGASAPAGRRLTSQVVQQLEGL